VAALVVVSALVVIVVLQRPTAPRRVGMQSLRIDILLSVFLLLFLQGDELVLGVDHPVKQHQRQPAQVRLQHPVWNLVIFAHCLPEFTSILLDIVVGIVLGGPQQKFYDEVANIGVCEKVCLARCEGVERNADFLAHFRRRILVQGKKPLQKIVERHHQRVRHLQNEHADAVYGISPHARTRRRKERHDLPDQGKQDFGKPRRT